MTKPFSDALLPSMPGLPTLGVVSRVWRGDATLNRLTLAGKGFLFELHLLAVDLGTWPDVAADPGTLAAMLHMNPRPVERLLDQLETDGFVARLPDDDTRLRLRRIDALVQCHT